MDFSVRNDGRLIEISFTPKSAEEQAMNAGHARATCDKLPPDMTKKKPNLWPLLPFAVLLLFVALSQFMPEAAAESPELAQETAEIQ
jgi:hypothetical protein